VAADRRRKPRICIEHQGDTAADHIVQCLGGTARIGHELQALANINEGRNKDAHKVFSEAAHIAFKKHKAI
ncbi:MAG: hypothetical protein KGH62_01980, partial [Candidatus Micrarchaeota archaeon]|nr:hypothetical protein [Candidatus Micrarchaeota archaeon]